MGSWTLVHTTTSRSDAELVRGMLEENDIPAVVMDLRSSAYPVFGEVGVYVGTGDVIRALYLVRPEGEGP